MDDSIFFEWDENKARKNLAKHHVSFAQAARIFDDPPLITYPDRVVDGELRWHALGMAGGIVLLLVVHTLREHNGAETIRIISARKATKTEEYRYEHG